MEEKFNERLLAFLNCMLLQLDFDQDSSILIYYIKKHLDKYEFLYSCDLFIKEFIQVNKQHKALFILELQNFDQSWLEEDNLNLSDILERAESEDFFNTALRLVQDYSGEVVINYFKEIEITFQSKYPDIFLDIAICCIFEYLPVEFTCISDKNKLILLMNRLQFLIIEYLNHYKKDIDINVDRVTKSAIENYIRERMRKMAKAKALKEAEQKAPSWNELEKLWDSGKWTSKGRGKYSDFANYVTRTNQTYGMTYDAIRNHISKYDKDS